MRLGPGWVGADRKCGTVDWPALTNQRIQGPERPEIPANASAGAGDGADRHLNVIGCAAGDSTEIPIRHVKAMGGSSIYQYRVRSVSVPALRRLACAAPLAPHEMNMTSPSVERKDACGV